MMIIDTRKTNSIEFPFESFDTNHQWDLRATKKTFEDESIRKERLINVIDRVVNIVEDDKFTEETKDDEGQWGDVDIRSPRNYKPKKKTGKSLFGSIRSLVPSAKRQRTNDKCSPPKKGVSFHDRVKVKKFDSRQQDPVAAWYNDDDYEAFRQDVIETMTKLNTCHKKNRVFEETDEQTARGIERFSKKSIEAKRLYKENSRLTVLEEQDFQRYSKISDPEMIRRVYIESAILAKDVAFALAWKDREDVLLQEKAYIRGEQQPIDRWQA